MQLKDKVAVVTGGGNGIGRALCRRFAAEGARAVIVADIQAAAAELVAKETGGIAVAANVAREPDVLRLVGQVIKDYGAIDLFCSNAGIGAKGGVEAADQEWSRSWEVNVLAHVYAARAVLPHMLARHEGYLLQTVSAAGLLTQHGSAPYAVTKHAAVGLAEWLAITHGDQGIKVSVLCPQAVRTAMTAGNPDGVASIDGMMEPSVVAGECVRAIEAEEFLILPHKEVLQYMRNKTNDYGRWIGGMRKLQRRFRG